MDQFLPDGLLDDDDEIEDGKDSSLSSLGGLPLPSLSSLGGQAHDFGWVRSVQVTRARSSADAFSFVNRSSFSASIGRPSRGAVGAVGAIGTIGSRKGGAPGERQLCASYERSSPLSRFAFL